jgi:hypothetical protein
METVDPDRCKKGDNRVSGRSWAARQRHNADYVECANPYTLTPTTPTPAKTRINTPSKTKTPAKQTPTTAQAKQTPTKTPVKTHPISRTITNHSPCISYLINIATLVQPSVAG